MILVAFPLLFWNEGRAVKTYKALTQGASEVISVSPDTVAEENDGKLVHFSAQADTKDILQDSVFGVETNAIKLERVVEMYQWIEEEHQEDSSSNDGSTVTTYSYKKEWSRSVIDSTKFYRGGHDNPHSMAVPSETFYAKNVTVGAFIFPVDKIQEIEGDEPLTVSRDLPLPEIQNIIHMDDGGFYIGVAPLPRQGATTNVLSNTITNLITQANNTVLTNVSTNFVTNIVQGVSMVPSKPSIGDLRVHFRIIHPHKVSLVGLQMGNTLAEYTGDSGHSFLLLQDGVHSAADMFNTAMLFSLLTIGIAWIFYRPALGIFLLIVVIGLFIYIVKKSRETSQKAPAKNQPQSRRNGLILV